MTKPSLIVFKPSPELRNGTAVVICPGGGFMALVITEHGTEVAKYMTARGVTSFVLKYRLMQGLALLEQRNFFTVGRSTEDGSNEVTRP